MSRQQACLEAIGKVATPNGFVHSRLSALEQFQQRERHLPHDYGFPTFKLKHIITQKIITKTHILSLSSYATLCQQQRVHSTSVHCTQFQNIQQTTQILCAADAEKQKYSAINLCTK